ncbi:type II toxin-antitoxin system RelE/ParE family toxin [Candidatus Woesearchaeota archaeon]|nr:type II toxin-antitoxin system RelE/ParE family toxin [Candidatus Woesearchaeota archaeon]
MYGIEFTDNAKKQLSKLHRDLQERIIIKLERVRIRPETYVEKLVGESAYKLRVGDYRLIVDIDNKKLIVLVIKIGHRKNIYKEF